MGTLGPCQLAGPVMFYETQTPRPRPAGWEHTNAVTLLLWAPGLSDMACREEALCVLSTRSAHLLWCWRQRWIETENSTAVEFGH